MIFKENKKDFEKKVGKWPQKWSTLQIDILRGEKLC